MSERPLISFRQVTKRFPGVVALRDVSLEITPGELHAVVGENGAGKSTLVRCLSGVITDYDGTLLVRGEPVRFRGTTEAEQAGISIIHQELNLVEELSAAANIFLGREKLNRLRQKLKQNSLTKRKARKNLRIQRKKVTKGGR